MPTYDFICESCGYQFEQMQMITAKPLRKCPKCKKNKLKRMIGGGVGIVTGDKDPNAPGGRSQHIKLGRHKPNG